MREIVHLQAGQCGNQIGSKVCLRPSLDFHLFHFHVFITNLAANEKLTLVGSGVTSILSVSSACGGRANRENTRDQSIVSERNRQDDVSQPLVKLMSCEGLGQQAWESAVFVEDSLNRGVTI